LATKPISARKGFEQAIVLSAAYSSSPGSAGYCELGVRRTRTAVELWHWNEDFPAECAQKLPAESALRDIVEAITANELFLASIWPEHVAIRGTTLAAGQILALSWSADYTHQAVARLLARIDQAFLEEFAKVHNGVLGKRHFPVLVRLSKSMEDNDIDSSDLPRDVRPKAPTMSALSGSIEVEARNIVRQREVAASERKRRLAPLRARIDIAIAVWRSQNPRRKYPGGGSMPPARLSFLQNYLQAYVLAHRQMPEGIHTIPGGRCHISGEILAGFDIDFSALQDTATIRALASRPESS